MCPRSVVPPPSLRCFLRPWPYCVIYRPKFFFQNGKGKGKFFSNCNKSWMAELDISFVKFQRLLDLVTSSPKNYRWKKHAVSTNLHWLPHDMSLQERRLYTSNLPANYKDLPVHQKARWGGKKKTSFADNNYQQLHYKHSLSRIKLLLTLRSQALAQITKFKELQLYFLKDIKTLDQ